MHDVLTKKKNCRLRDSVQGEPITASMEDGSGIEGNTLDGKKRDRTSEKRARVFGGSGASTSTHSISLLLSFYNSTYLCV